MNLNGIFYDGYGSKSKEQLLSAYSGYDEETEQDEEAYMFEYDDAQAENLADEKKVRTIINYLNNSVAKLKYIQSCLQMFESYT